MTDTDKLEPGWYWVRETRTEDWTTAEKNSLGWWLPGFSYPLPTVAIIGPRLTPPVDSGEGAANG